MPNMSPGLRLSCAMIQNEEAQVKVVTHVAFRAMRILQVWPNRQWTKIEYEQS